jgi:RNA polymerase sigma factor (sigma-70 family)
MTDPSLTNVLRYLRTVFRIDPCAGSSDAQLLQQFVTHRDEAAFTALLERHGPLVLAVCRQVLGNRHDAEDAFQATFLVLVRKAAAIRQPQALAAWLHRVAWSAALTAKASRARRQSREQQALTMAQTASAASEVNDWQPILHEEIDRLPDKYRVPVVLCYLEGKTHEESASQLGWPIGTVKGRLARARNRLRGRLVQRGVTLAVPMLLGALSQDVIAGVVSASLVDVTRRIALRGGATATVAALARTALQTLSFTRLKFAAWVLLALGTAAFGAGTVWNRATPQEPSPEQGSRLLVARLGNDADGDPLPAGARLRLGSYRLRQEDRILALAYSSDGRTLVSVGNSGQILTWDAATGQPRTVVRQAGLSVSDTAVLSSDGKLLATNRAVNDDPGKSPFRSGVFLTSLSAHLAVRRLEGPEENVRAAAFSRDGRYLATGGDSDAIRLWDLATGQVVRRFPVTGRNVQAVALSPDGKLLAAIDAPTHTLQLWDTATGAERPPREGSWATSVAFSANGRVLACARATGEISLWNPQTGRLICTLASEDNKDPSGRIEAAHHVALTSDGTVVATTGAEGTLRLWDATSGQVRAVLQRGARSPYWCLAFSGDDRTLAVGGDSSEIALWDVATGQRIQVT